MKRKILNTLGINATKDIPVEDIFNPAINRENYGLDASDMTRIKALKTFCNSYNAERPVNKRTIVTRAKDAVDQMYGVFRALDHEEVWVLFLNRANGIIDKMQLCIGSLDETVIDNKRILKTALEFGASSIILFHNHPGGNSKPSNADIRHTAELKVVCDVFNIKLIDHIIICDTEYYSYADENVSPIA